MSKDSKRFQAAQHDGETGRMRTQPAFQNGLTGGCPGSGKSYAGHTFVIVAALDPTVEIKIRSKVDGGAGATSTGT